MKSGFECDYVYDWNILAQEKKKTNEKILNEGEKNNNLHNMPGLFQKEEEKKN